MKILKYIWHDCFVYEDEHSIIVFDYWKDPISGREEFPKFLKNSDYTKNLYVLVSHHHKDHFNSKIFKWEKLFPNVTFIISSDTFKHSRYLFNRDSVYKGYKPTEKNVKVLKPGDSFKDGTIHIEAFDSTDTGNAYVVEISGITLFHAGDLNAWVWREESTEEEIELMLEYYKFILSKIKRKFDKFDVAMFPVDPRMGSGFYEGAQIFTDTFYLKYFIPMHFCLWEEPEEEPKFKKEVSEFTKYAKEGNGTYIALLSPFDSMAF